MPSPRNSAALDATSALRLEYDPALPITAHRAEILQALARHPVIVVCGATGSGKTTQLPKLCLEAGRGTASLIGHTQPRRIAARALASRLAYELGTTVGGAVGYQVRFNDRTGPQCRLKLMTDGILLKELERDRTLRRYDTLIIDEAHERTLNIDLLLGVLKQLVARRAELRVIVTSATIDPEKFSSFFGAAPVIDVSGRSHPVELRYRPLQPLREIELHGSGAAAATNKTPAGEDAAADELSLPEGIVEAVRELDAGSQGRHGDTLVFLPGEKHIREAAEALAAARLPNTEVLPLFARAPLSDQERIFLRHERRRIVLATNVAETSLTVPGIRFVIDSGLARISRYSARGKVQRLPIERVSQASAQQRKGRCGREAPGVCIRLYSEDDFAQREEFTPPEVLRTNLASVILRMAALGLGEPEDFPFLDPPDTRLVNDGVRLLQELKAMDDERRVTSLGRQIAGLPVDPRLGTMLLAASRHDCLTEMLVVASFLEAQDPRERPAEGGQQASEKHALFADQRSDFITVLNLWRAFNERAGSLSGSQLRKWCREHFLSFMRMREWQDLHTQLSQGLADLKLRSNREPASYADLHQAILTGFLGSIGHLDEKREYAGPRGIRFLIAPGTPLASKPPQWVVAASLLETTRLYARMLAAVNPAWIEAAGAHLIKRSYGEPHWVRTRGFVAAYESVSLHGLSLVLRRRVNYGAIAPQEAREIFIREALIESGEPHALHQPRARVQGGFLEANCRLREELERLEAKIRRRDILVDERRQLAFYAARIPERVNSIAAFNHWRVAAERGNPRLLYMARADLMEREAPEAGPERFPDELQIGANRLPLHYKFEPAQADDGVTLMVPQPLVDMVNAEQLAWLVPGMRLEKLTALLRALPKARRKPLVPVPDNARRALEELARQAPAGSLPGFHEWLAQWVTARVGEPVTASELAALPLPDHLRMNLRVVAADDHVLVEGRDVAALKRKLLHAASGRGDSPLVRPQPAVHRQWDFGELPESIEIARNRLRLIVYPALQDRGNGVAVIEARNAAAAESISRAGVIRLAMLALPQQVKYIAKRMADDRQLVLLSSGLALTQPLPDALTQRVFRECFMPTDAPLPRTPQAFNSQLEARRARLSEVADRLAATVATILKEWRGVRAALRGERAPTLAAAVDDVNGQLGMLLPPDFVESTPQPWFDYLPRYLRAIGRRLERLRANADRDVELARRVAPFASALRALLAQHAPGASHPALDQLRWMIEEFRVSLHAQELKTVLRVSEKRLSEQLGLATAELT